MTVRYTRRAENDLANILEYLDGRSPQGARNVKLATKRAIDTTAQYPETGHATGRPALCGFAVASYPYLVYWTPEAGGVWIVHIRPASRKSWKKSP
jgi:plasmid stabilization system protein ParE